ncbi:hypothetical protein DPEC_G00229170 [Dallia pectoralis]|uniref:Uncharacterized protein n=1 Tax=Dallia pectoralis TaxID=75939 RepID=A0ACC2G1E7_DALPE|nr:hypothetical protein DPEC_G00229170 [Dallia pectoralis]
MDLIMDSNIGTTIFSIFGSCPKINTETPPETSPDTIPDTSLDITTSPASTFAPFHTNNMDSTSTPTETSAMAHGPVFAPILTQAIVCPPLSLGFPCAVFTASCLSLCVGLPSVKLSLFFEPVIKK